MANYYVVLGVPRGETADGIRTAYRGLVERQHRAAGVDAARIRAAADAYDVLSDRARRRNYDAALARDPPAPTIDLRRPSPETSHDAALFAEPLSTPRQFGAVRPSVEELMARLRRAATGAGSPKGGRVEEVHVEVVLAPDEAARGGALDVGIPVWRRCRACDGAGRRWYGRCLECDAQGVVEGEEFVRARVPRLAREATLGLALRALGLDDVALQLHVRIAPWRALG